MKCVFFCDRLRTVKLAVNDQGGSFCVEILQKLQWNTQMLSKLYVIILQRKYYPRYQICIYIYKHFPKSSQMMKKKTTLKKKRAHITPGRSCFQSEVRREWMKLEDLHTLESPWPPIFKNGLLYE